ncbi:integrase, catalytic region, zinc finger, CCHC-type containing protein [Tanacetum coccineum]|uniref:Integrase, catalytic region, zinc finger, CCHC-type containing protein n=1 Tax=Tanacetum coccineum TaxID=301880 RepID=A0ABQ5HP63_9ASTR
MAAVTETRPPMFWFENDYRVMEIRIHRYIEAKPNASWIWNKSIQNGPTPHPMVTDPPPANSTVMPAPRKKLDSEFNDEENKLEMADTQAEIILSQGLPPTQSSTYSIQTTLQRRFWDKTWMKAPMPAVALSWPTMSSTSSKTNNLVNEVDLQVKSASLRNVNAAFLTFQGSTEGSCDQQALETDRIQLQDMITSLRIQLDGLKVENVSLKRRYDELSKRMTPHQTVPREAPRNHSSLPVKSANARRVEAHHRTLNKKNRVDSNLLVKHSVSVSKLNNVCATCNKSLVFANHNDCLVMCDDSVNVKPHQTKRRKHQPKKEWKPIKRVWKPISKPVTKSKPQWQPTGRHFSLFEKYPFTRIMEPTDMPIELPPSASSSPQITMVVQIVLWYLDSGCSRHMTGDRARLINFVEKFIGTVRFGNDEYAAIIGYGDYKLGDTIISRVYYVEGLKHNLFSVGQFCDGGLEVAFRQHSCHIRNYDMVDLLKGSRSTNLYSISLNDMLSASPVCLLTKASSTKSWLWHRRLNHLNFGTLNELARKNLVRGLPMLKYAKDHLCPSCQLGKSKKASHPLKTENTNTEVLNTLHMDLCGPMRTESINGKKYILVIVDDYTRFGWVRFLRSKDETPQVIEKFIVKTQRALNATVRFVRTDNGTEFVNKTLDGWFESVGISHETSVPRSPQQNGVVERRNRTLMEAARTMLIFAKAPLFLWAEAVATACYTLNRSLMLVKLKAKAIIGIIVAMHPPKKAPRTSTNDFCAKQYKLELNCLQSGRQRSALVKDPEPPSVPPTKKQVDDLFQWFDDDEAVPIPLVVPTTPVNVPAAPAPEIANGSPSTTVISEGGPAVTENLLPHQIPLPDTKASHSNSVNIDVTPNNQLPHVQKWTQAHPLENIIGDKDRPVSTRKQLETDAMWCFFNEFLTHVEPKTYKQALEHSCWIEAMQEEIHEFERLDVWILVPCPDNILIIPLKWIFKIKLDEYGDVLKNKARLVSKVYRHELVLIIEESFAPFARLEAIRLFIVLASSMNNGPIFHMDVKPLPQRRTERSYLCQSTRRICRSRAYHRMLPPQESLSIDSNKLQERGMTTTAFLIKSGLQKAWSILHSSREKQATSSTDVDDGTNLPIFRITSFQNPEASFINQSKYARNLKKLVFTPEHSQACGIRRTPALTKSFQMLTRQDDKPHGDLLLVPTHFLEHRLVSCHPKSRKVPPSSTTELNTIALSGCCAQILCVQHRDLKHMISVTPSSKTELKGKLSKGRTVADSIDAR